MSYEEDKTIAHDGDVQAREALASRDDIAPELLYYLAEDAEVAVRRTVAANRAAPMHANLLLARDDDESVRAAVAEKFGGPAALENMQDSARLRDMAHEALMVLAKDQVVRVRQVLSEALKELAGAPADVIRRLAWDVESVVAAPVLRYSPVISDEDLIEIILAKPSPASISAVSEREGVSESVSNAIVGSADTEAIALLLGNSSAQIREETLDRIIADAAQIDLWHMPLAMRPKLPSRAAVKVARVVAEDVLNRMQARKDLSIEVTSAVRDVVLERLGGGVAVMPDDSDDANDKPGMRPDDDDIFDRASREWAEGSIDEETVVRELSQGDLRYAKAMIAIMADVPLRVVDRVAETHSIKGCVALAWRARLSAKTAEILQRRLANVPAKKIMRAQGIGYPLSETEMIWQIDFFRQL